MIKLVAFDLDGTIGDTIPMCLKALKKAVTPYVTLNDVSENDILETFGLNEKGMIKKLVGYNWEGALNDFYVIYEQMHIMCPRPFDGITELIEKLKKKSILIALVTGKGEKSCTITLRQFNMDTCFDKVKTGNPFKNNKAENFRELLADYKLQPDEMIYIGDTVSDIVSCREAMSMLIYSLLGQFDFGMFFSKFQCSALTDTPKLLYFRLPSMQTQTISGCSPLPRVFDL